MPDLWMDVDVSLSEVPVNVVPLIGDTDFKTIQSAVAYNAAGLALYWHFQTCAGAYSVTQVTPTTGGVHDWTDQGTSGIYTIEIPSSGGTVNNDTEGFGWFTGVSSGVCPWRGPFIGFRAAALNDAMIDGGDLLDVNVTKIADSTQTSGDMMTMASSLSTQASSLFTLSSSLSTAVSSLATQVSSLTMPSVRLKKNTDVSNFMFPMYDETTGDPKSGLVSITSEVAIDGAAFVATSGSAAAVGSGVYKINLAAAELNGDFVMLKNSATGAKTMLTLILTE